MNLSELWLPTWDLHKNKPGNITAQKEDGHKSSYPYGESNWQLIVVKGRRSVIYGTLTMFH